MTTRTQVPCNQDVVSHLLSRFQFRTYTDLQAALAVLTRCVLSSMQAPAAYALPLDQKLPDEMGPEGSFTTVHPQNVATALVSVALAGPRLGGDNLAMDPGLQLWIGDWTLFNVLGWTPVPITVSAPIPAPIPVAPAPAPPAPAPAAPAPAPVPAHPATGSVMDLVNAALAGEPAAAVVEDPALAPGPPPPPAAAAAPAPPPAAVAPIAPTTVPATPTVATNPPPPPRAAPKPPGPKAPPAPPKSVPVGETDLPDSSVALQRTGATGRPQASPFTKKVEPRTKVGEPPFWWGFMLHAAERILTQHPAQALDPDSQGSGPVQAYALLLHLLHDKVLAGVDGFHTVAALRTYLKEVIGNIDALPSADAINQLADSMLGEVASTEAE